MAGTLTWLGHSAFRIDTPGGKRVYVDPFLNGNPKCPEDEHEPERVDLILLTHGHDDHVGDTIALYEKFSAARDRARRAALVAGVAGRRGSARLRPGKGGTVDADGIKVTVTDANHSSSIADRYMGEPMRPRRHARGRLHAVLRRRHERLRRHGAHPPAVRAEARGAPDRRPLHDGARRRRPSHSSCSASSAASPATGGRSASSRARRTRCASSRRPAWRSSTSSPAAPLDL